MVAKRSPTRPTWNTPLRYAIYYSPAPTAPLIETASRWLGRDAFSGQSLPISADTSLTHDEITALTADPRRYGFHATLKAPFRLAPGVSEAELLAAFSDFCATTRPLDIPHVVLGQIGDFFAIVPDRVYSELQTFAGSVVEFFEPFRAPLSEADIARRRSERLSPAQLENLHRWGYPYVFDEFRFHLTLTGQVPEARQAAFRDVLASRFSGFVDRSLSIEGLGLFREDEAGTPFTVQSWLPLGAS